MDTVEREVLPRLPDIGEVSPVGPVDDVVFDELREVLVRHDALQRFGITLLHEHFEVANGEILVESIDSENRIITLRPMSVASSSEDTVETSWRLDSPTAQRRCEVQCVPIYDSTGQKRAHDRRHFTTG